jgi:integrase
VALPPGLIQIKGRRGYYVNIPVPREVRRAIRTAIETGMPISEETRRIGRKGSIQKKASDSLEEARKILAEEQVATNKYFDKIKKGINARTNGGPEDLRNKYRSWQNASEEEVQEGQSIEVLTAEEALDLEIEARISPIFDPRHPHIEKYNEQDEALLNTAIALKQGLHHWSEWIEERSITSKTVVPLVEKRWKAIMKKFTSWTGDEYPSRSTKQHAVEYKRHLLTRTSKTGQPAKQSTVAKELRDLSAFWNWARRHEWAGTNIWEGLASGLAGSEIRPLPDRQLVEAADQKAMEAEDLMYLIQRFTGCRKQAVSGLRGRDIDLKNGVIHFVEYEEDGRVRRLKNGQEAHVPIASKLLPFLSNAKEQMPDGSIWPEQYKASEQSWGDRYGDTFPDKYGFNSHDLRRIVETQMAEANASPYFTFYITGHRVPGTSRVTQQYVRPTVDELREIIEKIN